MVLFGSLPQLFDITVSCAYMAAALQPWIALIVFILLITYIPLRYCLLVSLPQRSHLKKSLIATQSCKTGYLQLFISGVNWK